VLTTPTLLSISSNISVAAASTFIVRLFGDNTRQGIIEYRIFKDIQDTTRYYAVRPIRNTVLTNDLLPGDAWIYVDKVSNLQIPDPVSNTAGVVVINGERIVYGVIDRGANRLGNLRRGTAGTGVAAIHQSGTLVVDSGNSLEITTIKDQIVTATTATYITNNAGDNIFVAAGQSIKQGQMEVNLNESLETSNTQAAQFIRQP